MTTASQFYCTHSRIEVRASLPRAAPLVNDHLLIHPLDDVQALYLP
jgi:hypothetical protein